MRSTATVLLLLLLATPLRAAEALKITGYLQTQYVRDERSRNELGGSSGTRNLDQFSIRRGRVKFAWQVTPALSCQLSAVSRVKRHDFYALRILPLTFLRAES